MTEEGMRCVRCNPLVDAMSNAYRSIAGPPAHQVEGGCVGLWRSIGDTLHGSTVVSVRACCNRV